MTLQIWHFRVSALALLATSACGWSVHFGVLQLLFYSNSALCKYLFILNIGGGGAVPLFSRKKTIVSENGCVVCHQNFDVSKIINEKGCLQAGEEWIERNVLNISSMGLFITFWQVKQAASSHNYMEEAASDIYIWEHP